MTAEIHAPPSPQTPGDRPPHRWPRFPAFWLSVAAIGALLVLQIMAEVMVTIALTVIRETAGGVPVPLEMLMHGMCNVVAFTVMVVICWWLTGRPWNEVLPLRRVHAGWYLALAPTLSGLSILLSEVDNMLQSVMPAPIWIMEYFQRLAGAGLAGVFVLGVVAPFTEEYLFRGIILRGLRFRYPAWAAVVLSAFLFMVMHILPWQFPVAFTTGLLLGYLRLRTGSLVPCIFAQAYFNLHLSVVALIPGIGDIPGYTTDLDARAIEGVVRQPMSFTLTGAGLLAVGLVALYVVDRLTPGSSPPNELPQQVAAPHVDSGPDICT